ncbi:hypothetical protein RHGRI_023829 [Rhododendron griersonianum]|uniref:Uncharacterized protein n=1 Tax=Rhododendron griersonianum TaxID=479676 RepID=A0AAV6J702_9ERIC|nr:hypothetical protein RHGRI_023829 [Rhododendron griersonianum]
MPPSQPLIDLQPTFTILLRSPNQSLYTLNLYFTVILDASTLINPISILPVPISRLQFSKLKWRDGA